VAGPWASRRETNVGLRRTASYTSTAVRRWTSTKPRALEGRVQSGSRRQLALAEAGGEPGQRTGHDEVGIDEVPARSNHTCHLGGASVQAGMWCVVLLEATTSKDPIGEREPGRVRLDEVGSRVSLCRGSGPGRPERIDVDAGRLQPVRACNRERGGAVAAPHVQVARADRRRHRREQGLEQWISGKRPTYRLGAAARRAGALLLTAPETAQAAGNTALQPLAISVRHFAAMTFLAHGREATPPAGA
jgi:hypothetical protein